MTFLAFRQIGDTGKTKTWRVDNSNDGSYLGIIRWHGPWRKYVLLPQPATIWSPDCLHDVAGFIEARMAERRVAARGKREATNMDRDQGGA